jgi:hypothetical protein
LARAKQTARAEARRRHRAATRPVEADPVGTGDAIDDEPLAATASRSQPAASQRRPSATGGVLGSFRQAYHRPEIQEDLAALPRLLGGRFFLLSLLLIAVGIGAYELYPGYSGAIFLLQFLAYPPAIAPIFVAGFFAPRASYLLGLVVAVFDGVVYSVFALSLPHETGSEVVADAGTYILAFLSWAFTGIFFGAGAAWYRRFLQLTSPRRQGAGRGKPPSRGQQAATAGRKR